MRLVSELISESMSELLGTYIISPTLVKTPEVLDPNEYVLIGRLGRDNIYYKIDSDFKGLSNWSDIGYLNGIPVVLSSIINEKMQLFEPVLRVKFLEDKLIVFSKHFRSLIAFISQDRREHFAFIEILIEFGMNRILNVLQPVVLTKENLAELHSLEEIIEPVNLFAYN